MSSEWTSDRVRSFANHAIDKASIVNDMLNAFADMLAKPADAGAHCIDAPNCPNLAARHARQGEVVASEMPKGWGIGRCVLWTELNDALAEDGLIPPRKCPPNVSKWIDKVVTDYLTTPPAQPEQAKAGDDIRKARTLVDHVIHGECGAETLTEVYDLLTAALPTTTGEA